jgi:hypothetical protein
MSETLIRITLAVIVAAVFGTAVGIGWVLWYRQPTRETAAQDAGVQAE